MEVKPVGRERDIQIAELRGHEVRRCDNVIYIFNEKMHHPPVPHYSTSLTDCWPLWEEMTKEFICELKYFIEKAVICRIYKPAISDTEEDIENPIVETNIYKHSGEDELDAISGAYTLWMINNIKLKGEDNG